MKMRREDIEKIYDQGKDAMVSFISQLLDTIEQLTDCAVERDIIS
jgi:hypothetical protein